MDESISKELKRFLQSDPTIVLGVVRSVDLEKNTIEAEVDKLVYSDIRLNATAVSSRQKMIVVPEVKSTVILARVEHSNDDYKVLGVDKVAQVFVQLEHTLLEIDKDGVKIERSGQNLKTVFESFMDAVKNMIIATSNGPATLAPNSQAQIEQQKILLGKILK